MLQVLGAVSVLPRLRSLRGEACRTGYLLPRLTLMLCNGCQSCCFNTPSHSSLASSMGPLLTSSMSCMRRHMATRSRTITRKGASWHCCWRPVSTAGCQGPKEGAIPEDSQGEWRTRSLARGRVCPVVRGATSRTFTPCLRMQASFCKFDSSSIECRVNSQFALRGAEGRASLAAEKYPDRAVPACRAEYVEPCTIIVSAKWTSTQHS